MNLLKTLRETALAVLPVCAIVCILAFTIAPLETALIGEFLFGSSLVITGLSFFLNGAELGIIPAGSYLGAALTRSRKILLILGSGFVIGFFITIAEPDLHILGSQVQEISEGITANSLILSISLGIAVFLLLALARVVFHISFRFLIIAGYAAVFAAASRITPEFVAVAFDSGGATTGPMTVPFIIALGIGVSAVREDKSALEDSFGFTGIASIGPILAVALLGLLRAPQKAALAAETALSVAVETPGFFAELLHRIPETAAHVFLALAPIACIILLFQIFFMKLPPKQTRKIAFGFFYAWLGLVFFFTGTETAFVPAGRAIGSILGASESSWILIPLGCLLGAIVVCAEPAIWVLTEQVEEISAGNIRKPVLLTALALGVAAAVGLSMFRILEGFSIWLLLLPFYGTALGLTFVTPRLFTAIAFDSGGVASGPMASTFILSLAIGAASSSGGNPGTDGFGVIALIAATPLVTIQLLGILYQRSEDRVLAAGQKSKEALR
ncbi:MAG TPA: DUF1538 domain-containing protein [Treponemataceae bacterium]|nr:DUF1538 domain-containing protein [Treponemataceae bacterium]